jgi:hypothetical protein
MAGIAEKMLLQKYEIEVLIDERLWREERGEWRVGSGEWLDVRC